MTIGSGADNRVRGSGDGLTALASLNFNVDVDERERCGSNAGDAAGLADCLRTDAAELLLHLAGEASDVLVVKPRRDAEALCALQLFDRLALLVEITGVLDLGFDGA